MARQHEEDHSREQFHRAIYGLSIAASRVYASSSNFRNTALAGRARPIVAQMRLAGPRCLPDKATGCHLTHCASAEVTAAHDRLYHKWHKSMSDQRCSTGFQLMLCPLTCCHLVIVTGNRPRQCPCHAVKHADTTGCSLPAPAVVVVFFMLQLVQLAFQLAAGCSTAGTSTAFTTWITIAQACTGLPTTVAAGPASGTISTAVPVVFTCRKQGSEAQPV